MRRNRYKDSSTHVALYGAARILRGYCETCRDNAFVVDSELLCCGQPWSKDPVKYKRMTETDGRRRRLSKAQKSYVLAVQGFRCLYCDIEFGKSVERVKKEILVTEVLKVHWDHLVPFVYSQDNSLPNYGAACQLCNGMKGSKMFQTLEEAREFLDLRRIAKRIFLPTEAL